MKEFNLFINLITVQLFLFMNFFIEREIIAIKKNAVPISWRPSIPNMFSDKYIAMAKIIKIQNSYFFINLITFFFYSIVTKNIKSVYLLVYKV